MRGLSNKEIAEQLVISRKTAGSHVEHIYAKIGVSNRARASLFAMKHGLIAADCRLAPRRRKIGRTPDEREDAPAVASSGMTTLMDIERSDRSGRRRGRRRRRGPSARSAGSAASRPITRARSPIAWAIAAVVLAAFAPKVETALSGAGWQADGSESVQARTLIERSFAGRSSSALTVVVHSPSVTTSAPAFREAIAARRAQCSPGTRASPPCNGRARARASPRTATPPS